MYYISVRQYYKHQKYDIQIFDSMEIKWLSNGNKKNSCLHNHRLS